MERGAEVLSAGVVVVSDWFERHRAAISRWSEEVGERIADRREGTAAVAMWAAVARRATRRTSTHR